MVPAEAGNSVVGFYTLAFSAVAFGNLPLTLRKKLAKYPVPVKRIGELAVDNNYKGIGMRAVMVVNVLERIATAADQVAV